ncbi:helix-turn-helix transcriptional regulator [Leuconostoc mesenteroides]|uniref:helix-turn-helix transcriptional regulator n=1 Tax=Leuconostoc mesenteroides TaxID=1245 RepID=UPI000C9B446A|nr:helix-turn-helix domain-containing protein [Leuconostoc mesenteroides]PND41162.1 XRE family transcriptional regulator [Leuconostoc mesenteroides]UVV92514.1 helix-turn-helix domain-containing protein [Leuconostoc mesenteroides]
MLFSSSLKQLRLSHNLSQTQLAKRLNVSPKTISNWENERNLPDIELVIKIARILDVTIDELIIGNNQLEAKLIKDGHNSFRDTVMAIVVTLYSSLTGMLALVWILNIQSFLRNIVFLIWLFLGFLFYSMIKPDKNQKENPFDSISPIIRYTFVILFMVLGLAITIGSFWLIVNYPKNIACYVTMLVGLVIIIMTKPIWPRNVKSAK